MKNTCFIIPIMPPLGDAGQGWDIGIAESTDLENWTKIGELGRVGKTEEKESVHQEP